MALQDAEFWVEFIFAIESYHFFGNCRGFEASAQIVLKHPSIVNPPSRVGFRSVPCGHKEPHFNLTIG